MNRYQALQEWKRSVETLGAAELLARGGYPADTVSRAYYAILHAAKAALHVRGVVSESHRGVRKMFGKHLILSGAIERPWARYLSVGMDDRLAADYDAEISYSIDKAQEECERAEAFLGRIRRYLLANGFTEDELAPEVRDG